MHSRMPWKQIELDLLDENFQSQFKNSRAIFSTVDFCTYHFFTSMNKLTTEEVSILPYQSMIEWKSINKWNENQSIN